MSRATRWLSGAAVGAGGGLLALGWLAAPASAHVSPDKTEMPAGSFNSVTLSVGHGCEESPTRELRIEIPEGVNEVTPQIHPGWTIEKVPEQLSEPIDDGEGGEITERVKEVVFKAEAGNELADGYRDTFTLGFKVPDTPGTWMFFKTIQSCEAGEHAWVAEYEGEGPEPDEPAPAIMITEAEEDGHGGGGSGSDDAADDAADAAGSTDDDSDDDSSSNGLAIGGLVLGAAGLATGGAALARSRNSGSSAPASSSSTEEK